MAGGIKISEPAADMAVAAALISAHNGAPLPGDTVFFGEIGLAGEIRTVSQPDIRLKEAGKLGFERAVVPKRPSRGKGKKSGFDGLQSDEIDTVQKLTDLYASTRVQAIYA